MAKFAGHAKLKIIFQVLRDVQLHRRFTMFMLMMMILFQMRSYLLNTGSLGSLGTSGKSSKNRLFAKMSVCNCEVVFQLDIGAETNTIGEQYVNCELVRSTSKTLRTWNGSQVRPVGEATPAVLNPRTNETHTTDFIVVPNGFSNLLGLPTLGIMNLIHVNRDIFDIASISEQDVIRTHPTVFVDAQGKLPGKTTLHVSESHSD